MKLIFLIAIGIVGIFAGIYISDYKKSVDASDYAAEKEIERLQAEKTQLNQAFKEIYDNCVNAIRSQAHAPTLQIKRSSGQSLDVTESGWKLTLDAEDATARVTAKCYTDNTKKVIHVTYN